MKRKCYICKKEAKFTTSQMKGFCGKADCGIELNRMMKEKQVKMALREVANHSKENRAAVRELNKRTLSWQHKTTQPVFNKYRRLKCEYFFYWRNLEPSCVSCGKEKMDWCGGHFKTVGSSGSLRYDENNIHLQCNKYCNMSLSGNIEGNKATRGYTKGLVEVYGKLESSRIIKYCENKYRDTKLWTCEEVEEIRMKALKDIRHLEKVLSEYR